MEKISAHDDDLLLNFLDGKLDVQQSKEVEDRIRTSPGLRSRLDELDKIHTALKASARMESPSSNFTQRVMDHLDTYQSINILSPRNGLLLFGGIVVAVGIGLLLMKAGVFDTFNGTVALDSLPVKKDWIKNPIPSIPVNGKRIMEIVLIVITGLSFVLLDRTILRPYFERRAGIQF